MARYIDATKCAEILSEKLGIRLFDLVDVFAEIPSADVVPKSEVERLQAEKDALIKNYAECMKDYASEIFAEIERIILDNTYPDFNREHKPVNIWKAKEGYDAFYELKKKYTEGKQ